MARYDCNISLTWDLYKRLEADANGNVSALIRRILEAHYGQHYPVRKPIDNPALIGYREAMERYDYKYGTLRTIASKKGLSVCKGYMDRAAFERYAAGRLKGQQAGVEKSMDAVTNEPIH